MEKPDLSGRRVGGFELIEPIASGGFATVYRARQLRLDREVAVKVLDGSLAKDPEIAARFEREGRAAASLDHPNVVPVYEAGEDDGLVYLAMRLVPGETLDDLLLREGPLTAARAARLLEPVAAALDHAHDRGLIHRDVKPSNIFIEGKRVWLGDFGIAATADQIGNYTTGTLGTAHYMAPEQASQGEIDGRADLYALGCVVHRCLTGRPPYDRGELVATLVAHVNEPVPQTGEPALDNFLSMALAKAPEDRFAHGADLVASLRSIGPIDAARAAGPSAVGGAAVSSPAPPTTPAPSPAPAPAPSTIAGVNVATPDDATVPSLVPQAAESTAPAVDLSSLPPPVPAGSAPVPAGSPPVAASAASGPPEKGSSGPTGRWRALVAGLLVVAVLLVGAGVAWRLLGDDGGEAPPEEVAAIVGEQVEVGAAPLTVTVVDDSVFVANTGDESISVVPTGGGPVDETPPLGTRPVDMDGGRGKVWVTTDDPARAVLVLDVAETAFQALDLGFEPARVAADGEGAWVTDPDGGRVVHLDQSGAEAEVVEVDGEPGDIVLVGGSVWVTDGRSNALLEIDPGSAEVVDTIELDITVGALTASDEALYVTDRDGATVSRVDLGDRSVGDAVAVAPRPTRPEFGAGGLWLLSPDEGTLHRYDADTLEQAEVVDVEGVLGGLAIAGDDLWVTRFDTDQLVRVTVADAE